MRSLLASWYGPSLRGGVPARGIGGAGVRRGGRPAVGLVLDRFHILGRGGTPGAPPPGAGGKNTLVQLPHAPGM